MSGFLLFNHIPYDISGPVVPLKQNNMLCQFPQKTVYKTKRYIFQEILSACHAPDAVVGNNAEKRRSQSSNDCLIYLLDVTGSLKIILLF